MAFEAGPINPQPFSAGLHVQPSSDVIDALPEGAAERLRQLRQHARDLHALTVPFDEVREVSTARIEAQGRLKRLTDHQHDGGFNLKPDDPRVFEHQRRLDKLTDDLKRLNERNEVRTAAWRTAGGTLHAVETWLRDGRPPATALEEFDGPELKLKAESIADAIERLRRRGRELKADIHRIQSAPFPSSYAKAQMRAQIEALAMLGAPDVADLIEHARKIVFQTQRLQSSVYNTEKPAIAFAEVSDAVALLAWLHRDAMIKRLDAEIDAEADDAAALTHEQRQQREAEVIGDILVVERDEAALVWSAMAQGLPVEHRADINPVALLGVRLITQPRANPSPGTSPQHVVTFAGVRR